MEINRIIQFRAVFETESIREAASYLNMTPGALSKAIKVLASEVGANLFVQKGRNIVPTDEARDFYHKSSKLLSAYDELFASSNQSLAPTKKAICIASWEVFTSYFIGYLCENFLEDYDVKVLERTPHNLEESLLRGECDVGITYAPIPHRELTTLKITSFDHGVFAKRGAFKNISLSELPFATPITQVSNSPTGIKTLDCWPEDVPRRIKYKFELLETALETCRRGLSVIHCPKFVVKLQNEHASPLIELSGLKGLKAIKKDIYLVMRRAVGETTEIKILAKAIRLVTKW